MLPSTTPGGGSGSDKGSEDGGASPTGSSPSGACPSCRQVLCSCSLKPSPGLLNYQRLASTVPSLVYPGASNPQVNTPYSPDQVAYLAAAAAAAAEHSALYAAASGGGGAGGGLGDLKDGGGGLGPSGWAYPSVYHPYDPGFAAAAAAAAAAYPFNGYPVDMNGSRRKNATRETTSTLKAWLEQHKKNPYPTKGEKIMLAIITKMTLTQVSTWFANARRRLKKENKMTWEPRNRPDDEDVDVSDSEPEKKSTDDQVSVDEERLGGTSLDDHHHNHHHRHGKSSPAGSSCSEGSNKDGGGSTTVVSSKPRIWSLADLAGNGTASNRSTDEERLSSRHHINLNHNNSSDSSSSSGSNNNNVSSNSNSNHNNNNNSHHNHAHHHHPALHPAAAAALLQSHLPRNLSHHAHHSKALAGSAFSPITSRSSAHSESLYRGLFPMSHGRPTPADYHPDNP